MGKFFAGLGLVYVAIWIAAIIGWVMNFIDTFGAEGLELGVRIVGIFVAPAGAIMGWVM